MDAVKERRPAQPRRDRASRAPALERAIKGPVDLPFAMLVILILVIGLIMMFSASYASALNKTGNAADYFLRQGLFALMGTAVMFIIAKMDYEIFRVFAVPLMVTAVVLLILVPFIGIERNGATRWLGFGSFQFQPSEIAKLAVIVCFSAMISVYKDKMKTFRYGIAPFAAILALIAGLMILEPHLSGTILILGVGAALMFVGGVHWGWFAGIVGAGGVGAYLLLFSDILPYATSRVEIWRDPFVDPQGKGFQAIQSLYAIGSGGWFGLGLGKSRQKFLYLPEPQNDFVFSIVCEELGLIGAFVVLLLFAILIMRGYWIAIHARDRFGSLMVTGIVTLLAIQTIFNVAVVTNLIPVTGMSMPFFSYGGTSLLIQLAEMGIVLAVSRQIPAPKAG